jgi:hypothetical protein
MAIAMIVALWRCVAKMRRRGGDVASSGVALAALSLLACVNIDYGESYW